MNLPHKLSFLVLLFVCQATFAQQKDVTFAKGDADKKINILVDGKPFTSFWYPDSLEKPFLYPIYASNQSIVTRRFPFEKREGEPTDHPHHIGMWFNFENVNGLDFWNNSFAIPAEKKNKYGWIKTTAVKTAKKGKNAVLNYTANWTNQANDVLLTEATKLEFKASGNQRFVERTTTLTANQEVNFNDAKDGMLGFRMAQELQIPTQEEKKFTDDKGNVTAVKASKGQISNGNYLTSEGKTGDSAWGTRGNWCKAFGKIGADSVSIIIIDHPKNINYPTYWHARGYGLFAANPLGAKAFTNGKEISNLNLKKGQSVTFKYLILIENGNATPSAQAINKIADGFGREQ